MNRIDRLFAMVTCLQARKYATAEKLAETFRISVRTVYRDVKALTEGGVPVSFEPGRGYFLVAGYFLPPVAFTSEEANALLLMEAMVADFADASVHAHYAAALQKIKAVLRPAQREKADALQSSIRLQLPACLHNASGSLSVLQTAIGQRTVVELEYKNNRGEVSRRRVEPIGLVFYAFGWHLIGWCHLRQAYRDFKAVRILKARNTFEPFTQTEHLPLADYIKQLPVPY